MKKFGKIAAIGFGIIVLLIVLAALIIPRVLNPNQYKDRIITLVKEQTGRELQIPGDISVSIFPWIGAKIGKVTLGNAPGFQSPDFARVDEVKVRVKLFPLLSKQVQADVVSIKGLALNLERQKDGKTNWDDLLKPASQPPEDKTGPAPESAPAISALLIGGVEINGASVTWTDGLTGTHVGVKNLFVQTSEINLKDPVTAEIDFDLDSPTWGLAAAVTTKARMEPDLKNQRYGLQDLALKADLTGKAVPGKGLTVTVGGSTVLDLGTQKIDMKHIKAEITGLTLAAYSTSAVVETSGAGDLGSQTFDLTGLKAAVNLTSAQDKIIANLDLNAGVDLKNQKIALSQIHFTVPEMAAQGIQAKITSPKAASARLDLASLAFDVKDLNLAGTVSGEAIPGKTLPVTIGLRADGNLKQQTFSVVPLEVDAAGIKAIANLNLVSPEKTPEIKGTLALPEFSPKVLMERLGMALPRTADPQAFATAQGNIGFSAGTDTLDIHALSLRLDDSRLTGTCGMTHFATPDLRFDLALDRMTPEKYLPPKEKSGKSTHLSEIALKGALSADAGFKTLRISKITAAARLDGKIPMGMTASDTVVNLGDQTVNAGMIKLKVDEMDLQAKAKVTGYATKPAFTADVQAEPFNLRHVLSSLDVLPQTADPKALTAVEITSSVSGTADAVSVSSLKLRLDDTRIEGKADVKLAPAPAYVFDIRVDAMDVDRYLAPVTDAQKTPKKDAGPAATPGAATVAIPVETLRALDLDGKIAVGKLKLANLRLTDIQLQTKAKEGLLTLYPVAAKLYGGTYNGNISFDARGQLPKLSLDEKLTTVQAGDLLKDLQGKAFVTGTANTEMKLTGSGADADAIVRTLDGNVSFKFIDGSIMGMDIAGKLCRALSTAGAGSLKTENLVGAAFQLLAPKTATKETTESDRTMFSEMGGSMQFSKGVGTNQDLALKSPLLRVEGAGTLDLPKSYLDYKTTVALVKSCEGQGGKGSDELTNYPVPVAIKGPLDNLEVRPDLTAGILQVLQRRQEKQAPAPTTPDTSAAPATATPTESQAETETVQPQQPVKPVEEAVKGIFQELLKKK